MHTLKTDVIFLSMSTYREWQDGIVNRSRHILRQLQMQGATVRVLHVDFPPRTWKGALRRLVKDAHIGGRVISRGFGWKLQSAISNQSPQSGIPLGEQLEVFVLTTHWPFSERVLQAIVRKCSARLGFSRPMLWSYNPLLPGFFTEDYFGKKIFDAVDDWRHHPAYKHQSAQLTAAYKVIGQGSDVVFTVSKKLVQIFPANKTHWIPNGVDVAHFQKQQPEPQDLQSIPHPRIGYVGVIQSRLDFVLLRQAAIALPAYYFVFCGWVWEEVRAEVAALSALPNVHFLGRKDYALLPAYVQHVDVGIIPHKLDALTESMDPLKLYEYLACCKPVVATGVPLSVQSQFVLQASSTDEFISYLQRAAVTASAYVCDAKNLAQEHGWEGRVASMLDLLK